MAQDLAARNTGIRFTMREGTLPSLPHGLLPERSNYPVVGRPYPPFLPDRRTRSQQNIT